MPDSKGRRRDKRNTSGQGRNKSSGKGNPVASGRTTSAALSRMVAQFERGERKAEEKKQQRKIAKGVLAQLTKMVVNPREMHMPLQPRSRVERALTERR